MSTCPTVKVKADNDQGFIIINESDFDADKHELFGNSPVLESKEPESTKLEKKKLK